MSNGYVIYDGPSRSTRKRIVVIATGFETPSSNRKTGDMIQTWVLVADTKPTEAVKTGADRSICGDCPLRPFAGGEKRCYVVVAQGPTSIWNAWKRGRYPHLSPAEAGERARAIHKPVRIGAYGDPAMAPDHVWRELAGKRRTGYTHQWRTTPLLRDLCMASVDTEQDLRLAWKEGWRTFRVIRSLTELKEGEINCPASDEAGKRTTCARCGLCNGAREGDKRPSIAIIDHGPTNRKRPV